MRFKRYTAGVAIAAMLASVAPAQLATAQTAPETPVAGQLDPSAEQTPQRRPTAADFDLAEGLVVLVNDVPITSYELRQRMLLLIAMTQVQPTAESLPAIQRQALNNLIDEKLQRQELARFQVNIPDEEVDAEIAMIAQSVGITPEAYLGYLAETGVQPETVREQIRVETGWQALVRGRYGPRARVGRNQVDQTIQRISASASRPQYLVGEIFIDAARVGGQQAAMNGANQLVEQIIQGAPFMAVARQFSAAPSAASGGDAGWLIQGEVPQGLQTALDNMEPGQLSRPIPVEGGVYILYLRDKRDGSSTSMVNLRQVMIEADAGASDEAVAAATARLNAIRSDLTCDNILERSRQEPDLLGADLGESDINDLAPQFQQVARSAEVRSISAPVRTPLGVHLLAVCDRRAGGPAAPNYDEVESRLRGQQLSMLARRYIRDLREDAHIDFKG
ncbi:MAG: peptidylprolyl isomerase [Brevundimonas sp.]|uniref:peptidylprolyl isomerase n=1 Tax=Brevundimonas sp. TaxID=1871086 RepID=UPI00391D5491